MSGKLDHDSVLALVQAHVEKTTGKKVARIYADMETEYDARGERIGSRFSGIKFELAPEDMKL